MVRIRRRKRRSLGKESPEAPVILVDGSGTSGSLADLHTVPYDH